jgi:K+-sensing histidine kinase KdpD
MTSNIELNDFAGKLIHTYNNHLSSMMGYAELALLECNDQKVVERLNKSLESGISAAHFGKTILASMGRLQLSPISIRVTAWFASLIKTLKRDTVLIVNNNLKNEPNILMEPLWLTECCIDLVQFLQAFLTKETIIPIQLTIGHCHLLSNKKKYIEINLKSHDFHFSHEQQQQLFTPFYSNRLMLSEKGIGLAKVKGFLEQLGASIQWDNHSGFTIQIGETLSPVLEPEFTLHA